MTFQRGEVNLDVLPQVEVSADSLLPPKSFLLKGSKVKQVQQSK